MNSVRFTISQIENAFILMFINGNNFYPNPAELLSRVAQVGFWTLCRKEKAVTCMKSGFLLNGTSGTGVTGTKEMDVMKWIWV